MLIIPKLMDRQLEADICAGLEKLAKLPRWLVSARDPGQVAAMMAKIVPEFRDGDLHIEDIQIGHIRFKEMFWTGLYEVTFQDVDTGEKKTVVLSGKIFSENDELASDDVVEGRFGSREWYAVIPELHLELKPQEEETILDALQMLTSPDWARQFLEENIRQRSPAYAALQIASAEPHVVRYKPGSRCTIVYNLQYPNGDGDALGWPHLVVGKTYRGEKGRNAYDSMEYVWQSPLGRGDVVTVAEPLAYIPEMRILIQGPIRQEVILKDLIEDAVRTENPQVFDQMQHFLDMTARGLAELHRSGVTYGLSWTWKNEVGEIRERVERLSEAIPELATTVDPLLERISALFDTVPPDTVVPSHGSFRPAQVLINQGRIGFIDFDSFAQSEPGLDLGLFLATVMNMAVTSSPQDDKAHSKSALKKAWQARYDRYLAVCDAFLDEYEKYAPVSRERFALWQTMHILMMVLTCWTKNKTDELEATLFLLRSYLTTTNIVTNW